MLSRSSACISATDRIRCSASTASRSLGSRGACGQDVFRYHWMEESQHGVLDELEWEREDRRLSDAERDIAVDDFIELVGAVDGILQAQSAADADYFAQCAEQSFSAVERQALRQAFLDAYRYQYIISGVTETRLVQVLGRLISNEQLARIQSALAPIL